MSASPSKIVKRSDVLGAILAGGESSRMGTEKARLPLRSMPLIQHAANVLSSVFQDVIVARGERQSFEFLRLSEIPDEFVRCGPLGGIHAALRFAFPRDVFVLSCDMPFVSSELVEYILDFTTSAQTKIASIDGNLQPLCGLYSADCLPTIERNLERGVYGVQRTLKAVEFSIVPILPGLSFYRPHILLNVNRREDYRSVLNIARRAGARSSGVERRDNT